MACAAAAARTSDSGRVEAGAAGSRRFYDASTGTWMVKVFPGDFYVTGSTDETLVTVLGSCVAACIRDPRLGIGGMNHFMLPHSRTGGSPDNGEIQIVVSAPMAR